MERREWVYGVCLGVSDQLQLDALGKARQWIARAPIQPKSQNRLSEGVGTAMIVLKKADRLKNDQTTG